MCPAIGIDLGTTFSVGAVYRNHPEVISDPQGERVIPSVVFYHPETEEICVGAQAEEYAEKYPGNVIFDIKRIIGRKFNDIYVQQLIRSKEYQFKIVDGLENGAGIELQHNGEIIFKTPEEISAEILKYLRESAQTYLDSKVTDAVISVPAYFSNAQKKAVIRAAEIAKLKVLKLITEPVAAAVYYAEDRLDHEARILVFDFGGGTLDVSIIEVDEKMFKVKSIEGDTFLGGRDFDKKIMDEYEKEMIKKCGDKIKEKLNKKLCSIRNSCVNLKISLSTKHKSSFRHTDISDSEKSVELLRTDFENFSADLVQRAKNLLEKCLKNVEISKDDINLVLLVGGTTRIPKVKEMLGSYFGKEKLKTNLNPDEAVALGAAMAAVNSEEFEKYKITEITPLSLGLSLEGDLMKVLIEKNTPLPAESKPVTLHTVKNNQTRGEFKIFEGERKKCQYNNLLGSFIIDDLPAAKAGDVKIKVIYSLNEDGILTVEAHEYANNKSKQLAVTLGEYRLCDYAVKNLEHDALEKSKEDKIFEENVNVTNKIKKICNHILYDLRLVPLDVDRDFIEQKCKAMKSSLKNLEHLELDTVREEYKNFTDAISELIASHIKIDFSEVDDVLAVSLNSLSQPERPSVNDKAKNKKSTKTLNKKKHR